MFEAHFTSDLCEVIDVFFKDHFEISFSISGSNAPPSNFLPLADIFPPLTVGMEESSNVLLNDLVVTICAKIRSLLRPTALPIRRMRDIVTGDRAGFSRFLTVN